jgi:WD40 repeat protein
MRALAFTPDDRYLAGGGRNGRVRIWDLQMGQEAHTFPAHRQRIRDLTFDQQGDRLITAGEDRAVRVWNWQQREELYFLAGTPGKILAVVALPGDRLATAGSDNMIRIWDLNQRQLLSQLRGHHGSVATLDANDQWLVSGSFDASVRIWPLEEMQRALTVLQQQRATHLTRGSVPSESTRPTVSLEAGTPTE